MDIKLLLTDKNKKIAIVGAGKRGLECAKLLGRKGVIFDMFLDNDQVLVGKKVNNVPVSKVKKIGDEYVYIITPWNEVAQMQLKKQLVEDGVDEEKVVLFDEYEYYKAIFELGQCKNETNYIYKNKFGIDINWDCPLRYTELLNIEKISEAQKEKYYLVDKLLVRDIIKEKIGEKYLTKIYKIWNSVDEVDFEDLPNSFVIKLNNGSGRNIIIKEKKEVDLRAIKNKLSRWMSHNYAYEWGHYELQYQNVIPRIFCEEYLEGLAESVYDNDIFCFGGEPQYIWSIKGSHRENCVASFYDIDWNKQEFSFGYPKDEMVAPRPKQLDRMLELSAILARDFEHVRVDWYDLPDGRLLFSELTFTSWAGLERFEPNDDYDFIFGDMLLKAKGYKN